LLAKAQKPIILAGGGVIISNASDELMQISDLLMAPVATTFMGKGAFPESHPLSVGSI
jgi:acetolactate synthase-1/2/3 large subunit